MKKGDKGSSPDADTTSVASHKGQKSGDTGKLQADSTITKGSERVKIYENGLPNCGCPNKRDAFFDKLLNYLEKQSDVISRCCFDDKSSSVRNKRSNTDPVFDKGLSPCANNSTCDKSKREDEENLNRPHKSKEECKIIIEVCTCGKDKRTIKPSASSKSVKSCGRNPPDTENQRSTVNENDCSGCDKKVDTFFKLAEEICQAYLANNRPSPNSEQNMRVEEMDGKGARGYRRSQEDQNRVDNRDTRGCNSLAVEIECNGDKEEFVIQPCECGTKIGRIPSHYPSRMNEDPKKSCLEMFEERYGQILRDLHSKLIKNNPQPGTGQSNQQQQYPTSQQPTYPPPQQPTYPPPQQPTYPPPQQQYPSNSKPNQPSNDRAGQYPPNQNPYQQPTPSNGQPYYGQMADQEENDEPKRSSKGKKKKRS